MNSNFYFSSKLSSACVLNLLSIHEYYNNKRKKKSLLSINCRISYFSLPALHHTFDLPAPFVLHTDCPHYWRYHLPGCFFYKVVFPNLLCYMYNMAKISCMLMHTSGETEEEFSTRLANNLEALIQKEGPDNVML